MEEPAYLTTTKMCYEFSKNDICGLEPEENILEKTWKTGKNKIERCLNGIDMSNVFILENA